MSREVTTVVAEGGERPGEEFFVLWWCRDMQVLGEERWRSHGSRLDTNVDEEIFSVATTDMESCFRRTREEVRY